MLQIDYDPLVNMFSKGEAAMIGDTTVLVLIL